MLVIYLMLKHTVLSCSESLFSSTLLGNISEIKSFGSVEIPCSFTAIIMETKKKKKKKHVLRSYLKDKDMDRVRALICCKLFTVCSH
jgi:hypothetical protein